MIVFLKNESRALYLFLKQYRQEAIVIACAALFLTLFIYHQILNQWVSSLLYFLVLPLLVILFILRKNPLDFGFRIGNYKIWGWYVLVTCIIAVPVLYAASHIGAFQSYYNIKDFNLSTYSWTSIIALLASEFLYRGFLLFGLKEKFKEGSIFIQMIPFVLTHFGKPEIETLSTIITGILFGYIAYKGKSYWPILLIHIFINLFFVAVVNFT